MTQTLVQALEHHRAGRLRQAEALYREVLASDPNQPDALHLLGVMAYELGRHDLAVQLIGRALAGMPENAACHYNLGLALYAQGQLDAAIASYQYALALDGNDPEIHFNLGLAMQEQGRLNEAAASYQRALALQPDHVDAHNNLGNIWKAKDRLDEAIVCYRRALALNPRYAQAHNNLGAVLVQRGQLPEALACFEQALAIDEHYAEAHSNRGVALQGQGRFPEALAAYQRAIQLQPEGAEPRYNRSMLLLLLGDLPQGWAEYEWRWRRREMRPLVRNLPRPLWDGGDLGGQTLFLHAEQGLGDTLQFIRYLPQVLQRNGQVIVECQAELKSLLWQSGPAVQWMEAGEPLPAFDWHCPLLSLPRVLGTTLSSLPRPIPYLQAQAEAVQHWRERLAAESRGGKVGLVWAGRPQHKNDRHRSLNLSALTPLGVGPNTSFYSLQKGPAAQQAQSPPGGMRLIDHTEELKDFADTAALVANLDLVISVDTAVVHLAGAMGKEVWVLLPFVPDWRWLLEREDSPWYPSLRLFRQPALGDWDSVIGRVAQALAAWSA